MGVEEVITAYVFCGGEFFADNYYPASPCDFSVAADSGMYTALVMGIVPDLFIGDFDSFDLSRLSPEKRELVKAVPTMTYPAKKDLTDSMIAINVAIEKGADNIIIYGALGGRLDHTLSNVLILRHLRRNGIKALINNGKNTVRYIENESITVEKQYKYISLIALAQDARGVSISGAEYSLDNAVIEADRPYYAVSNRIVEKNCRISVKDGGLMVVESDE